MKAMLGSTYEQIASMFNLKPEKHYYSSEARDGFSIFIGENEYLFRDNQLFSIEIACFDTACDIPGFVVPIEMELEKLLALLSQEKIQWEIYPKYSRDHWVVIKLSEHDTLYEFEFSHNGFELQYIRLEFFSEPL